MQTAIGTGLMSLCKPKCIYVTSLVIPAKFFSFYLLIALFLLCLTVDTPDPYLMMRIPSSAEIVRRTKCVSNNKNPEWKDEPFVFHIDPEENNVLGL